MNLAFSGNPTSSSSSESSSESAASSSSFLPLPGDVCVCGGGGGGGGEGGWREGGERGRSEHVHTDSKYNIKLISLHSHYICSSPQRPGH